MKKKKTKKSTTIQVRMTDEQYNAILEEAEKVGLSMSAFIRFRISQQLAEERRKDQSND